MSEIYRQPRLRCDLAAAVFDGAAQGRRLGEGRILNLSLSGCRLRFAAELRRGRGYRLTLDVPEGAFELPCRVAREDARGGDDLQVRHYGLVFNLSADQETLLRLLLARLRREAEPPLDAQERLQRTLRDYWRR